MGKTTEKISPIVADRVHISTGYGLHKIEREFKKFMELSGDGAYSVIHLSELCHEMGFHSPFFAHALLRVFDTRNVGYLNFEDYMYAMKQLENPSVEFATQMCFTVIAHEVESHITPETIKSAYMCALEPLKQKNEHKAVDEKGEKATNDLVEAFEKSFHLLHNDSQADDVWPMDFDTYQFILRNAPPELAVAFASFQELLINFNS